MVEANTTLGNGDVSVLQAVNLTLGTGAFLATGDSLPKLFPNLASITCANVLYVTVILSWAIKLLVENHRSFAADKIRARPTYAVFQLIMTVLMFSALIASARSECRPPAAYWLSASLFVGMVWLAGLAAYYFRSVTGFIIRSFPWLWLASAAMTVFGAILIGSERLSPVWADQLYVAMLSMLFVDAFFTRTFSIDPLRGPKSDGKQHYWQIRCSQNSPGWPRCWSWAGQQIPPPPRPPVT